MRRLLGLLFLATFCFSSPVPGTSLDIARKSKYSIVASCGDDAEVEGAVDELAAAVGTDNVNIEIIKLSHLAKEIAAVIGTAPSVTFLFDGQVVEHLTKPITVGELRRTAERAFPVQRIETPSPQNFTRDTAVVLLGGDETFVAAFYLAANALKEIVKFYELNSHNNDGPNAVRIFTNGTNANGVDETFEQNESLVNAAEIIRKRILRRRLPASFEVTPESFRQFVSSSDVDILWLASDEGLYRSMREDIASVAMKKDVPFGWLDTNKYENAVGALVGVTNVPAIVYVVGFKLRYVYPEPVSSPMDVGLLEGFLSNYAELEPFHMSEEVPKNRQRFIPGEVFSVYGKTIRSDIYHPDKDVLMLVYSPWDAFCRALQLEWAELADDLAVVPHIVIAKIDGTANEAPGDVPVGWTEYPTILFIRASEETPMVYNQERTIGALKKYLMVHSSKPFEVKIADDDDDDDEDEDDDGRDEL